MSDKLARFNALREKYGFLAKCVKADRLIAELAYSTGYDMFVLGLPNGSVRRSRLNRFVKRARISDGMLCDFLKNFDKSGLARESAAGEGGDAVRIMSMHASKGLEFPVVILPCLESDFVLDYPAVSAGTELGIALDCYDFARKEIFPDVAHAANCLVNRRKQTEEELRLLYVALTRAKIIFSFWARAGSTCSATTRSDRARRQTLFLDHEQLNFSLRDFGHVRHARDRGCAAQRGDLRERTTRRTRRKLRCRRETA